ncbi:MAG: O-antigen ligase family protein [Sphingomonas sp.]|uniref:O-antigen ligase family protein n=1 Tax=Sphingomonas sp. TaxID=28214 RepID=UPI0025F29C3A|nr:O-antigen ligase family protein [Sphingomonas sp.]MBX9881072.1 O-antigen ligase family protein [Sphingomonas sp.]
MALVLVCAFGLLLTSAGGASRADLMAQAIVRAGAFVALAMVLLFQPIGVWRGARPVAWLLGATILLVGVQLVPLPPALWQALPGRALFAEAAVLAGRPQPWRPLSLVPSATVNALGSLSVPLAVFVLALGLRSRERQVLPTLVLAQISMVALIAVLQASGFNIDVPLADLAPGEVSGSFSNRNHFAVFMALGSVIAPYWALMHPGGLAWRAPVAIGLVLVFLLLILASGSRVGLTAGSVAIVFAAVGTWRGLRAAAVRLPRWAAPALIGSALLAVLGLTLVSVGARRAASIERLATLSVGEDLRSRSFSTITQMISDYFPVGTGFGSFDPIFRLHEPDRLLRLTYLNHAHNDVLEVVLDGGMAGALLLLCCLSWWAFASVQAWRRPALGNLAQPGSVMVLVLLIASLFDYPLRTPLMMEILIVAALWLATSKAPIDPSSTRTRRSAPPRPLP